MITIKLSTYSDAEKEVLFDLLGETLNMFDTAYCPYNQGKIVKCPECEYRNVCYDVNHIHEFMARKILETEK